MGETVEGLRVPRPVLTAPPSTLSVPTLPDLPPCMDYRSAGGISSNNNGRRLTSGFTLPAGMTHGVTLGSSNVGEDYTNPPNTCRLPPGAISHIGCSEMLTTNRRWTGPQFENQHSRDPVSVQGPLSSNSTRSDNYSVAPLRRLPRDSHCATNGWMSSTLSSPSCGPSTNRNGSSTWRGIENKGFSVTMNSARVCSDDPSSPLPGSSSPPSSSAAKTGYLSTPSNINATNAQSGKQFYNRPTNFKSLASEFNFSSNQIIAGMSRSFSNGPDRSSPNITSQPSPSVAGILTARNMTPNNSNYLGSFSRLTARDAVPMGPSIYNRSNQFASTPSHALGFTAAQGTSLHKAQHDRSHSAKKSALQGSNESFGYENTNRHSSNELKPKSKEDIQLEEDESQYDQIPLTKDDPVQAAHRAASKSSSILKNDMGSSVASPMKSLIIRSLIILQETPDYDYQPPTIVVNPGKKRLTKPCIKKRAPTTPTKDDDKSIVLPAGWTKNEFGLISIKPTEKRRRVTFDYMPKVMPFRGGEIVEELIA